MKKAEQMAINVKVEAIMNSFADSIHYNNVFNYDSKRRLRSCNADVYTIGNVHFLKSYATIVAIIVDGVCFDFLRNVYGYTASSAKQISKFCQDYGAREVLTWRYV